jgi:ABC-2 type transport system permease protein
MRSEIQKELRHTLRSGRFIILLAGFLFFALLTPVMLKIVLPQVLASQTSRELSAEISNMMNMTQIGCIQSYMGDVFEIGTIIIAFTLCGLTALEIRENRWVLPLCAGKQFGPMLGAKLLVFGAALITIPIIALLADYSYSGILFGFEVGVMPVLYGGLLQGIYMLFLLACLIMWGVLMKKPVPAGFMTLATAFGIHFSSSLLKIYEWTPSGLLAHANMLTPSLDLTLFVPLGITIVLIVLMMLIALLRLKRMEWNTRNI